MQTNKKARLLTMDELQARPCEVDGRPALFHRWAEEGLHLLALVEYKNGTIDMVDPLLVRFTGKEW